VRVDAALAAQRPPLDPGDYVLLRVEDTGQGMAQDTLDHVFEPFFTTKPVGEGTGLGLATVYGIVKQTGGFIWAESEPGVGTAFDIYLPRVDDGTPVDVAVEEGGAGRAAPSPVAVATGTAPSTSIGGRSRRPSGGTGPAGTVLLVEDEAGVRKLSRRILERAGFEVLAARDGEQALQMAAAEELPIDLVLTDMVMPRMSGKQLAKELNRIRPGTRILFMSGYTGESLEERGDLTKTDVVLEKPFSPAELVDAVRDRLEIRAT
jgi:CheY-like chemotaxis protein